MINPKLQHLSARNHPFRAQDDLRVLLLDSVDPLVRELAEASAEHPKQQPKVEGKTGPDDPPSPPRGQVSPLRSGRRGSDARMANTATVSSIFRR